MLPHTFQCEKVLLKKFLGLELSSEDLKNRVEDLNLPSKSFHISSGTSFIDDRETTLVPQWISHVEIDSDINVYSVDLGILDLQNPTLLSKLKSELNKEDTSTNVNILTITIVETSC